MTEMKKDRELSEKELEKVAGAGQDRNKRVGDRITDLRKRSNDAALGTPDLPKKPMRSGFGPAVK